MHIVFASVGYSELLGIEFLAAYLKRAGHRVSLVHDPALFNDRFDLNSPWLAEKFDVQHKAVARILELKPDILAFSCITSVFKWSIEVAAAVRKVRHVPVVMGGVHPSAIPQFVLGYDEVDFAVVSEGEDALLALAEALAAGGTGAGIPNVWHKVDGVPTPPPSVNRFIGDLDGLPFPDKDLYAPYRPSRAVYNAITARGCPYRCTYCFNNFFAELPSEGTFRDYNRRRSVGNVLEELRYAKKKWDFGYIEFHDDIFTMNRSWLEEFLPRYLDEIGRPFACHAHARFIDVSLAKLLKRAGCIRVSMGVQSLDSMAYRQRVLKRAEKEGDLGKAIDACNEAGIALDADHIVGLPGESDEGRRNALLFYRKHTPTRIGTYWLAFYPGIEMTLAAHAAGDISDEELHKIYRGEMSGIHEAHALTAEYRREETINRGYVAAYNLMPLFPARARGLLDPEVLAKMPVVERASRYAAAAGMLRPVNLARGRELVQYLRHYTHNLVGSGRHALDLQGPAETHAGFVQAAAAK